MTQDMPDPTTALDQLAAAASHYKGTLGEHQALAKAHQVLQGVLKEHGYTKPAQPDPAANRKTRRATKALHEKGPRKKKAAAKSKG